MISLSYSSGYRRLYFAAVQKAALGATTSSRPATVTISAGDQLMKHRFSTQAATAQDDLSSEGTTAQSAASSGSSSSAAADRGIQDRPRNKALADIIRLGLTTLNRSALDIQNNGITKRGLFEQYSKQDLVKEYKKESNHSRLMQRAQDCLSDLAEKRGLLMVKPQIMLPSQVPKSTARQFPSEPIVLVDCKFTGHRSADIYWSLPVSVLLTPRLSKLEKQFLEYKMSQHITEHGAGQIFAHAVHQSFAHKGFPPKVTLVPAKDAQILQLMEEFMAMGELQGAANNNNANFDEDALLREEYERELAFQEKLKKGGSDDEDEEEYDR